MIFIYALTSLLVGILLPSPIFNKNRHYVNELKVRLGDAIDTNSKMITNVYEVISNSNWPLDDFKKKLWQVAKKDKE